MFAFSKLEKHAESYDATNKEVFGKVKIGTAKTIDTNKFVALIEKTYVFTCNNKVDRKRNLRESQN